MIEKLRAHDRCLAARKRGVFRWSVPASVKREVLRFLEELGLGKVNRGLRISESRQTKYLDVLKIPLEFFQKPTTAIKGFDVERFEKALNADVVRSRFKNKPYAHATKTDIRRALQIYLRWRLGEAKATQLAGWLDTRDKPKTPDYLTEQEIEKLFKACKTAEQRYLVAVLFDSGARAEEFTNIRFEDFRLPEGKENYLKITFKQEFSKTLGRTISLYWRGSFEVVRDYLSERIAQGIKPEEPVFAATYDGMRMFLRRLGRRVLNKHVHPHLFRHSSATYYATKLNRQELCYRYGWKFSSSMPDVYISRAGMENKELDVTFASTEIGGLKDELAQMRQETKIKDERNTALQSQVEALGRKLAAVEEVLAKRPTVEAVERALRKKKGLPAHAGAGSPRHE